VSARQPPRPYPTRTIRIGTESVEVPDWDAIQAPERAALLGLAQRIGYGRCIQILQQLWYQKARSDGRDERSALLESGTACPWCHTDSRTGKYLAGGT
jgi:hypothetical protein